MSKLLKNVIIAFTMLCVVVLIVFLVEMLIINGENSDGGEKAPTVSGSAPSGNLVNQGGGAPPSDTGGHGNDGTTDEPPEPDVSRPPPSGKRHELEISSDRNLVVYADEELFSYEEAESEDVIGAFTFLGSGTASLEIRFVYMQQGVSAFVTNFLSMTYEIPGATVAGEEQIRNSPLSGIRVTGNKDIEIYEAWIHVFADAEVEGTGLALVINYENEMQKLNLYEILDSLDIIEA